MESHPPFTSTQPSTTKLETTLRIPRPVGRQRMANVKTSSCAPPEKTQPWLLPPLRIPDRPSA
jgi:hypothetical protein